MHCRHMHTCALTQTTPWCFLFRLSLAHDLPVCRKDPSTSVGMTGGRRIASHSLSHRCVDPSCAFGAGRLASQEGALMGRLGASLADLEVLCRTSTVLYTSRGRSPQPVREASAGPGQNPWRPGPKARRRHQPSRRSRVNLREYSFPLNPSQRPITSNVAHSKKAPVIRLVLLS